MASSTPTLVEHVVLFKVKEGTSPERIAAQVSAWRGLKQLEEAAELTSGPVLEPLPSGFTHALYARYEDKAALEAYNVHPDHQSVVRSGAEVVDNVLAVDWEATPDGPTHSQPPAAVRILLLKTKEGVQQQHVREAVSSYKALLPQPHDGSLGTNFTPARGQGYNWGIVLRFQSVDTLDKLKSDPRQLQVLEHKLTPLADSLIVFDLVN